MSVYCYRCGQRLAEGSRHCPACGAGIFYDEKGPLTGEREGESFYEAPPYEPRQTEFREQSGEQAFRDQYGEQAFRGQSRGKKDKIAMWAMICGLGAAFLFAIPFIGFPLSVAAIVLGALGLKSARRGMALTGLIMGIIFVIFNGIILIMAVYYATHPELLEQLLQQLESYSRGLYFR
ncbi:MAG: hypothetical protein J6H18_01165 [Lachnospiraceae bacterium]|nr:hypothetical protein [Lachnospiraceae bacterium]